MSIEDSDPVVTATRLWLERAVIGLNLCPFAKAEHARNRIRYVVSDATSEEALLADLQRELLFLADADPAQCETTLLIHPGLLEDFLDYNDFLGVAEALVQDLDLEGILQVASFHPHYQFADAAPDDITNCTNRSPHPTLHLLREASIEKAMEAFPDAAGIFERNKQVLQELGPEGWRRVMEGDAAS